MQSHSQSRTSQYTDHNFVKELTKPTQDKIVFNNFKLFKKIKRNAEPDKDILKSKQKMTLKPNIDNGLPGRTTEHRLSTAVCRHGG